MNKAEELFKRYTGEDPQWGEEIDIPDLRELAMLGTVGAIEYEGKIANEDAYYRHEFTGPALMLGAPNSQGLGAIVIIGNFKLTKRGITG